jgi:hypothetical protein
MHIGYLPNKVLYPKFNKKEGSESEKVHNVQFHVWYSGKDNIMLTMKRSVVTRGLGVRAQRIFPVAKLFLWCYNGGYILLYICQNPQYI